MKKTNILLSLRWCLPLTMLAAVLTLTGCDKEEEPIPAYLTIEPFEITATDPDVHGSISEKITHARVFLTDQNTGATHTLGVLALPATVPSIVTGDQQITVDPMIKANGNTLYLQIYPFYRRFTQNITLSPNEDLTITPSTSYVDDAVFEFIEDFEKPEHLFETDRDDNPETFIEISQDDVFEGQYSGKITLDTANNVVVVTTNDLYTLSFDEVGKVFMEVNYKTDVPLEFGVLNIDNNGVDFVTNFEFIVLARSEWNKIYFDLTDLIATASFNRFVFAMRAGIPFDNGYTLDKAEIYLDNIKLIHF